VDNRAEVREFLISRRAKITSQQAGMPHIGARRVPGLRRAEVAALAGVSVEYDPKLERGAIAGVSASILDAIARALQLDDAERAHLFHASTSRKVKRAKLGSATTSAGPCMPPSTTPQGAGTKHFHHHDVGDLQLAYESVDMISEPGLTLTLYAAEPGSPTAQALDLLASWTAVINDTTENAQQAT
jgi:hypothetical protein